MARVKGTYASSIIEMTVKLVYVTERGALVRREHPADAEPVWLALAQVELEDAGAGLHRLYIQEWLAVTKGLL